MTVQKGAESTALQNFADGSAWGGPVREPCAERLDRNPETKTRVEAALRNLDNAEHVAVATVAPGENVSADQQANTQEILAGSLPDPADVKPGEAWIVECRGERRTAVKDGEGGLSWNTINAGGYFLAEYGKNVTLVSRLVPAPRVITNADELDALAEGTIIRSRDGDACRKSDVGDWSVDGLDGAVGYGPRQVLPVTVLWEPGA